MFDPTMCYLIGAGDSNAPSFNANLYTRGSAGLIFDLIRRFSYIFAKKHDTVSLKGT